MPIIEKLHARIFSLHLKDPKKLCHDRPRTAVGNKWAIPAGVEFEYLVLSGSTSDAEIAACVSYARAPLLA